MGPSALEAASEQLGAGPYSPRGKPGRRRPAWPRTEDTRSPNSPFCWRRDACPELALHTHSHARRSQSSARSARPVWRARARRCVRASQQLGQGLGLGALALTARGRVATAGGRHDESPAVVHGCISADTAPRMRRESLHNTHDKEHTGAAPTAPRHAPLGRNRPAPSSTTGRPSASWSQPPPRSAASPIAAGDSSNGKFRDHADDPGSSAGLPGSARRGGCWICPQSYDAAISAARLVGRARAACTAAASHDWGQGQQPPRRADPGNPAVETGRH